MNTPVAVCPPKDQTLTPTPHIVSVLVGGLVGFIVTRFPLAAAVQVPLTVALTTGATTLVHFIMAELAK